MNNSGFLKTRVLFLVVFAKIAWGQGISNNDLSLLAFLDSEKAFLPWLNAWKQPLPELNYLSFQFRDEIHLQLINEVPISFESIQERNHLSLTIFSPGSMRAVDPLWTSDVIFRNGYYSLGHDDSNELRLLDFTDSTSSRLLFLSNYGPWIMGLAWLSDDLLVAIGDIFDLSRESDEIAPAVMLIDLEKMTMRTLIGNFIPRQSYRGNRYRLAILSEPRLAFRLRGFSGDLDEQ